MYLKFLDHEEKKKQICFETRTLQYYESLSSIIVLFQYKIKYF